jgi:deferrochelatase/peroxidase EfeB
MGRKIAVSRRGFLGGLGLAGFGAAAGAAAAAAATSDGTDKAGRLSPLGEPVPFFGRHQAGIATPAQDRLAFAAFDVRTTSRSELVDLLRTWTAAAAAMTVGDTVPGDSASLDTPPADTGEAVGLRPAGLTVTAGFGPSLFDKRFGLAGRRPAALTDIPHLPGDLIRPEISNGDIGIQACSNDPQVAFHAIRNLARLGRGTVVLRWTQLGFGRTSSTSEDQATMRNLMGFKDGTRNIRAEETDLMREHVWVGTETDQAWMRDGSYLVSRRIRMQIEAWDRDFLADQEDVFGRYKVSGAPLTGHGEFDPPDFEATRGDGVPVIPLDAHVRLASKEHNKGLQLLRRGYSYTDGIDPAAGQLDAGLFFIAYQQDPRRQFIPLQRMLATSDALNEYITHTSSAVFACPPGVPDARGYWGQALFSS